MATIMTFRIPARHRVALPLLAGLAMMSLPAAAQQQRFYGATGYGTSVVGAYNPYTQAGPGQTAGRAYGAAPVAPYPPAYGAVTSQSPPPRPGTAPAGPRAPTARPPAGQVGAYNPWRPQPVGGYAPGAGTPGSYAPYGPYTETDPGTNLPPPPPGPIRSRLLSIPETGSPTGASGPFQSVPYVPRRSGAVRPQAARRTTVAAAPAPTQVANGGPTDSPPPAPTPTPRITNPPRAAAKPAPKPAAEPKLAPPPVAAKPPEPPKPAPAVIVERPTQTAAAPPPAPARPAANGATRVTFEANSPALSADARSALDRLAADLVAHPARKLTLKAYSAGGGGPETRRLSLARGLAVRAYLIDKGVPRERLDVQALGASADSGPADRVDAVGGLGT
jgi:outer membrane protein OmpA-like peptidoglycan-associated protein